jgi:hypothetical protein
LEQCFHCQGLSMLWPPMDFYLNSLPMLTRDFRRHSLPRFYQEYLLVHVLFFFFFLFIIDKIYYILEKSFLKKFKWKREHGKRDKF